MTIKNHEQRLHEINTLDWDDLLVPDDTHKLIMLQDGRIPYTTPYVSVTTKLFTVYLLTQPIFLSLEMLQALRCKIILR